MAKKVTMQDIADKLGVSKVTVSKGIRGSTEISEMMRENIARVAEELGYSYEMQGKKETGTRTHTIGVITSERYFGKGDFLYFDLYRLLSKELEESGYSAMFHILDQKNETGLVVPSMLPEGKIDGLIILGQLGRDYLNRVLSFHYPIIFLDFYCDRIDLDVDSIITDNFFGAYEITNILIEKGHRKIGYVGNLSLTSSIQDRYLGYYKSLLEYRLDARQNWVIRDRDDSGSWIDMKLPEELPTAFVCNCDKTAAILIETLKRNGYRVPEDCSVVGFDDSIDSKITEPAITTVKVDIEQMAKRAVKIIDKKINIQDKRYGRVLVKGSIIKRKSIARLK